MRIDKLQMPEEDGTLARWEENDGRIQTYRKDGTVWINIHSNHEVYWSTILGSLHVYGGDLITPSESPLPQEPGSLVRATGTTNAGDFFDELLIRTKNGLWKGPTTTCVDSDIYPNDWSRVTPVRTKILREISEWMDEPYPDPDDLLDDYKKIVRMLNVLLTSVSM